MIKYIFLFLILFCGLYIVLRIDNYFTEPIIKAQLLKTLKSDIQHRKIVAVEIVKLGTYLKVDSNEYLFYIKEQDKLDADYRYNFQHFVKSGDTITKVAYNDTICITRNGVNHYWQIDTSQYYK